jgi:putative salt-induced outer membrane protein YdiY
MDHLRLGGAGRLMAFTLATLAMLLTAGGLVAQDDEKKLGWFFDAELAGVWTGGNSQSFTVGTAAKLKHAWQRSDLVFEAGSIRTRSSLTTRIAVGTPESFQVQEEKNTETTAENYMVKGRYDYAISPRFYVFGGADWMRDTFAGIDSRLLGVAGAGNTWADNDKVTFKTDYGLTVTYQNDVIENPALSNTFGGLRLAYGLDWHFAGNADFTSSLIADFNLNETDDIRTVFVNSLPVQINGTFALKPELRLNWRNQPSLTQVDLVDTGGETIGTVLTPLNKLDTFFTLALVVKL